MKKQKRYDMGMRDMTDWDREKLYSEVIQSQKTALGAVSIVEWIIGAFMLTLESEFHFGKQRMRKVLKGVQHRLNVYSSFPMAAAGMDFQQYLEHYYGYRYFFDRNGKLMLRDMTIRDEEYFDYLSSDLRYLVHVLEEGLPLEYLSDKEQKALETLKEILPFGEGER